MLHKLRPCDYSVSKLCDIKTHRPCCRDTSEELEGLCGDLSPQGGKSVSEQKFPAHPGCSLGPSYPKDPHKYSAGWCSAGLVFLLVAADLSAQIQYTRNKFDSVTNGYAFLHLPEMQVVRDWFSDYYLIMPQDMGLKNKLDRSLTVNLTYSKYLK